MYPKTSSKSPAILKPLGKVIILTVSNPKEVKAFENITGESLGVTVIAKFVVITLEGTKPAMTFTATSLSQLNRSIDGIDTQFADLADYLNRYTIYKLTQDMEIFR